MTPSRAVIAGNGVVALATAIALQTRGVATTIVAPDTGWRGASWGNAGHIATEQVEPLASRAMVRGLPGRLFLRGGAVALPPREIAAWLPFGLRLLRASDPARFARGKAALSAVLAEALPAWRRLLAEAGAPGLLREDGHFVVWESPATAARGRAHWAATDTGTTRWRDATAEERDAIAAMVAVPVAGAIRFSGSGQIADPAGLGEALHARFRALGGAMLSGTVRDIRPVEGGARLALDDGRSLDTDIAVVAAGVASAPLIAATGLDAPLIAERGYHLEAAPADWPRDTPPIVFEDRSTILTRFDGALRAASFVEFGRAGSPPDPRKFARLAAHLDAFGVRFEEPLRPWMGARPTLPDYLPAIGRSRRAPAIAYAFGHQHLGLTMAAATGAALAATLCGETADFDLTPFDLERFSV